jgi:hypothetical protein
MRRGSIFWGSLILVMGVILLINQFVPGFNAWGVFWPLVLVGLGVWFLMGQRWAGSRNLENEQVHIPLADIRDARITMHHGAGKLEIMSSGTPGELLSGSFWGGVEQRLDRSGSSARLDLRTASLPVFTGWPFVMVNEGLSWNIGLTREIPLQLEVETGASETRLNLQDLLITDLSIKTGASSSMVTLPANAGGTRVNVQSGAASVELTLPQGVAGRIHVQSGLAGVHIDQNRFPATGSGYETPGYETATNKAEIFVETGVASITIR